MRWSIKKIFNNLTRMLFLLTTLLAILATVIFTLRFSSEKVELILHQKALIKEVSELSREDIQLTNIQLSGIVNNLKFDITKMYNAYDYDILGNYLYSHSKEYKNNLEELTKKQLEYIQAATSYYDQSIENLNSRLENYEVAQNEYETALSNLEEKHLIYEKEKFKIVEYLTYFTFIISVLTLLWFSRRLQFIYKDLKTLFSVDPDNKNRVYLTEEAEMITKRMSRKPTSTKNPAFIDPLTEINNYKGLINGFANRKGTNGPILIVCVFSIDNFTALEKKYKKDITNNILKKIAFILSLHEQHSDVIGRIDYDQFVVILNRNTKESALSDCEQIRKSIEESKFKGQRGDSFGVTVSGGFVVKTPNKQLDQTILQAKEILGSAISHGGNRIAQLRDHAEKSLRE